MNEELLPVTSFARHGIHHLSPSTIQKYVADPALFVMEKLMKLSTPVGVAAHRGTAVEAGLIKGLYDSSIPVEECQQYALKRYDELTTRKESPFDEIKLRSDSKWVKERAGIPGMVLQGINRLRSRGAPSATQQSLNITLPGVPIPWKGFLDVHYGDYGCTLDIKTTHKIPSAPTADHCRQVALYTYGTNFHAQVAYISPTKTEVYTVENCEKHIADLVNIANRLERFLGISDDKEYLASLLVPDVESFYYSNRETREMARKVFGL